MKILLLIAIFLSVLHTACAQSYYLMPGTTFVRGVVSVETAALTDATWQSFAARTSTMLAVVGHSPQGQLAGLAAASGHPEVNVAPYVPYGLSSNGRRAMQTAVANAARCIAVLSHHPGRMFATGNDGFNFNRLDGSVAGDTLFDFTPAFGVPTVFLGGERDNLSGIIMPLGNFEWGRAHASPWAFLTEPGVQHTGTPMPAGIVTTMLEGLLLRRLPVGNWPANQAPVLNAIDLTTGWLADNVSKEIAPWASFTGERARATWLPDEASANEWASFVIGQPWRIPDQTLALPANVSGLQIFDPANSAIHPSTQAGGTSGEAAWKICANLKETDQPNVAAHGSCLYAVPLSVRGSEWIRPMEGARTYTGATLLSFTLTRAADVFIAHDTRIVTKPAWMSGWMDTGENLTMGTGANTFAAPFTLRLFRKSFPQGATVALGPNGGTTQSLMYLTIIKGEEGGVGGTGDVGIITSDASAAEQALDPASFTVTRGTQSAGDLTVNYTVSGTATSGSDFVTLSGSVVIPDGQNTASIMITPLEDSLVEGMESITLTLAAGAGYSIGTPPSASASLLDNDGAALPEVTVSLNAAALTEGAGTTATFTLTRTDVTNAALPVSLSVTGSAGIGTDYTDFPLNVSIPAGSASVSIDVGTLEDAAQESAETLVFTVVPTTAYSVGTPGGATLAINDNDTAAMIRLNGNTFATHVSGDLKLDLYLPRNLTAPVPCVVFIFGGGWQSGGPGNGLGPCTSLVGGGMAAAAIDHRRSSQAVWPAHLHDVKAAIRWLRAHAGQYGLDVQRFGGWGMSSGAHLTCMAALSAREPGIVVNTTATDTEGSVGSHFDQSETLQAFCAWYPPTDLLRMDHGPSNIAHNTATSPEGNLIGAAIQTVPERSASANPLLFIRDGAPPALIMHGTADLSVPFLESELLHDCLLRAGGTSVFCPMVGSGHGFPGSEQQTAVNFFRHVFRLDVLNQPPVVSASASVLSGVAPLTVDFTASAMDADGTLRSTAWSFGDNTGASGTQVSHLYNVPGTYRVTFCAQDDGRLNSNAHLLITVLPAPSVNTPPTALITAPAQNFTHVDPAALHVLADADAQNGASIATVEFFVNGVCMGRDTTTPYGLSIGGLRTGTHSITVRATDNTGAQSTSAPVTITVLSARPEPVWLSDGVNTFLGLRHHRLSAFTNRTYIVEASHDLLTWLPVATSPNITPLGIANRVETRDSLDTRNLQRRFLRMNILRNTP